DAAAICEAAARPDVKFVPVKSVAQQGILALHTARSLLVKQQTMLANAIRGPATEFGLVVPKGLHNLEYLAAFDCRRQRGGAARAWPGGNGEEDASPSTIWCSHATEALMTGAAS